MTVSKESLNERVRHFFGDDTQDLPSCRWVGPLFCYHAVTPSATNPIHPSGAGVEGVKLFCYRVSRRRIGGWPFFVPVGAGPRHHQKTRGKARPLCRPATRRVSPVAFTLSLQSRRIDPAGGESVGSHYDATVRGGDPNHCRNATDDGGFRRPTQVVTPACGSLASPVTIAVRHVLLARPSDSLGGALASVGKPPTTFDGRWSSISRNTSVGCAVSWS